MKRQNKSEKKESKKPRKEDLTLEQLERIKRDVNRAMVCKLANSIKCALGLKIDIIDSAIICEDKIELINEIKIIERALSRAIGLHLKLTIEDETLSIQHETEDDRGEV